MKEAFDLASIRLTLRGMLDKGLLPNIECLDTPSPGFIANTRVDRRTFPCGYEGIQHQNLLRDYHPETVDKGPDPRDFEAPTDQGPGIRSEDPPIQVQGEDDSSERDQHPLFDLDEIARRRIEETRPDWEPRGNHLHAMCEQWWLGAAQLDPGPYKDWSDNLFSHPLFTRYKAIGVETRLVDKRCRYAGSCDFVLQGPGTDGKTRTLVCDLKTKKHPDSAIGDHRGQLGAYCSMLIQHWPTLWIDQCLIVNSFPDRAEISVYEVQDCLEKWDDRYQAFADWKPSF